MLASPAASIAQFQTEPDGYDLLHSQLFDTDGASVLDNDPAYPATRTIVRVTREPLFGQLTMNVDGTFTYQPNPLYTGPDQFEYVIDHVPLQELTFVGGSSLSIDGSLTTAFGTDDTQKDIPITGTATTDIGPNGVPITTVQVVELDVQNSAAVGLKFDYTGVSVHVDLAAQALKLLLNLIGPPVEPNPPLGAFTQIGNKLGLNATVDIYGSGLLGGLVPSSQEVLDTETDMDLSGLIFNQNNTVTLILTVNSAHDVEFGDNSIDMTISGQISAVGPYVPGGTSNPEVVNLSVFSPVNTEDETPTAAHVVNVYPNPVTTRATISFELPAPLPVRIAVYDILGREVEVLTDGYEGTGRQQRFWDSSGHPRGIYFLKMTTDQESITRPIVLQ